MAAEFLSNVAAWLDRPRIRRRLNRVERGLRARDVYDLTPAQCAKRAVALDYLRDYWQRGEFPRNTGYSTLTPIFVDDGGRPCAVAHLLSRSGRNDVVSDIRATANLAQVREMQFPELVSWATQTGLTTDELALIQPPMYGTMVYHITVMSMIAWSALLGVLAFAASLIRPWRDHPIGRWITAVAAAGSGIFVLFTVFPMYWTVAYRIDVLSMIAWGILLGVVAFVANLIRPWRVHPIGRWITELAATGSPIFLLFTFAAFLSLPDVRQLQAPGVPVTCEFVASPYWGRKSYVPEDCPLTDNNFFTYTPELKVYYLYPLVPDWSYVEGTSTVSAIFAFSSVLGILLLSLGVVRAVRLVRRPTDATPPIQGLPDKRMPKP